MYNEPIENKQCLDYTLYHPTPPLSLLRSFSVSLNIFQHILKGFVVLPLNVLTESWQGRLWKKETTEL